jgi:hypothetical protein
MHMADYQDKYIATDFRQWYSYSQSAQSSKMSNQLKRVIEKKESQYGFTFEIAKTGNEEIYYLSEKYYPAVLRLTKLSCDEFLGFIGTHYADEEFTEENNCQESAKQDNKTVRNKEYPFLSKNTSKKTLLISTLSTISSNNKLKHSFNFSLITFLILQINILPGNISNNKVGDWGIYFFFGIFCLIYFFNIWSYSKLFYNIRSYTDIFRLTALYSSVFFLLVFLEITIIDMFGEKFNIWWNLFLIILGQLFGVFLSLFLTMILYFIKGGRMVNISQ